MSNYGYGKDNSRSYSSKFNGSQTRRDSNGGGTGYKSRNDGYKGHNSSSYNKDKKPYNGGNKKPYSKTAPKKPQQKKTFFKTSYVKPTQLSKEDKKLYFKRRYNVYDNTITVKVFSRLNESNYRLVRTNYYFEFESVMTEDDIMACIDKSVFSTSILLAKSPTATITDDIIKRVEIYISRKHAEVVKTKIFEKIKAERSYKIQYFTLDSEGINHTSMKY